MFKRKVYIRLLFINEVKKMCYIRILSIETITLLTY